MPKSEDLNHTFVLMFADGTYATITRNRLDKNTKGPPTNLLNNAAVFTSADEDLIQSEFIGSHCRVEVECVRIVTMKPGGILRWT